MIRRSGFRMGVRLPRLQNYIPPDGKPIRTARRNISSGSLRVANADVTEAIRKMVKQLSKFTWISYLSRASWKRMSAGCRSGMEFAL